MSPIALGYGIITAVALLLALASGKHLTIKLGLVLLLAWIACNVAVVLQGYPKAPLLIPSIDAALGIITGGLAVANRDRVAASVFGLFVAVVGLWWVAISTHTQGAYLCYLCANMIFLAQVAIVGVAGGRAYLADRALARHRSAHAHLASG